MSNTERDLKAGPWGCLIFFGIWISLIILIGVIGLVIGSSIK